MRCWSGKRCCAAKSRSNNCARLFDRLGCESASDRTPKSARPGDLPSPRNQDRTIGVIENAKGEITHDVVTEHAARLRGTGRNQIVITFADFSENLIDYDSVTDMHFGPDPEFFQILFLGAEIDSKL